MLNEEFTLEFAAREYESKQLPIGNMITTSFANGKVRQLVVKLIEYPGGKITSSSLDEKAMNELCAGCDAYRAAYNGHLGRCEAVGIRTGVRDEP